ncbi:MAG: tetratricopeptide repeat protein, partial [Planctomycetaceae bacterium]
MQANNNKIAAACWRSGNESVAKENWDYAIQMYGQAVKVCPDNLTYRQSLRAAEYKKYNNNKKGAAFAGTRLMGVRTRLTKARAQKKWEQVDQIAEEGLIVNPWDVSLNASQGEACAELGFSDAAVMGYRNAVTIEPEDKDYNRALARLLEERGEYADAIKCWERVRKVDELDSEARSKIQQLGASSVIDRGGYEDAKSTKQISSAYDHYRGGGTQTKEAVAGPGVSEEEDLKHAIRKAPEDQNNYMKLAALYRREKRFDESAEWFQKALDVSGGDQNIRELLEDVQIDQIKRNYE